MAVDGGVLIFPVAVVGGLAAGTLLVSTAVGVMDALEVRAQRKRIKIKLKENADRSENLIAATPAYARLPQPKAASDTRSATSRSIQAVWEARGKEWVLKLGAVVVLTFSATHLQAMELKPAAQLIHQQVAEHFPDADISFSNCKVAAIELGKQGGLKNIVEDMR